MKRFTSRRCLAALPAALLCLQPFAARAGDGPYLGVFGGANWESPQKIKQDGEVVDHFKFEPGWLAGVTLGYGTASGLRPELELAFRRNEVRYSDVFGADVDGFEQSETAFANLWYDIKTDSGFFGKVHPYIGGGVGGLRLANRNLKVVGVDLQNDYDTKFAYQGGAGFGFDLTPQLTASLDYRYVESERGHFTIANGAPDIEARYRSNSAILGLRYSFLRPTQPVAYIPPPPPPPPAYVPPPPPPPPPPAVVCKAPPGFKVDANCQIIEQSVVVRAVSFEYDSARLTGPSSSTLDEVAGALASQPGLYVEIQGHTDSSGSDAYNQRLSQQRAESVRSYLVGHGVNGSHLTANGYGESRPISSNDSDEGRAENRRVEFAVRNAPAGVKVVTEGATEASTAAAQRGEPSKVKTRSRKR